MHNVFKLVCAHILHCGLALRFPIVVYIILVLFSLITSQGGDFEGFQVNLLKETICKLHYEIDVIF